MSHLNQTYVSSVNLRFLFQVQFVLLPSDCRGVSKVKHLKIYWQSGKTPGFMAEVIGRCNGACIRGTLYKESETVPLPEGFISTLSVGQSCYVYFSPAVRPKVTSLMSPDSGMEGIDDPTISVNEGVLEPAIAPPYVPESTQVVQKRFPKIWSKAIMDVFNNLGSNEMSQVDLVNLFKEQHSTACVAFFGEIGPNIDEDLWSHLKRFVSKAPFEFSSELNMIKFDPTAVKARAAPSKKQRTGSGEDGEEEDATPVLTSAPIVATLDDPIIIEPSPS